MADNHSNGQMHIHWGSTWTESGNQETLRELIDLAVKKDHGCSNIQFTVEFEPHATSLEQKGEGYVVASLGEDSGYVPYTSFAAKKSYLEKNRDIIQAFTDALQKGMDYVQSHTPEEIAEVIAPQFAETEMGTLNTIVERYYKQDTWKEDLIFEESSFDLLQNILEDSGVLEKRVPYADLVTKDFAQKAAE